MFSNTKDKRTESLVLAVAPKLVELISSASSLERNAGMVVANAMLISGMATWGRDFAFRPMKLEKSVIVDAVSVLAEHHAKLEVQFASANGRSVNDPFVSACRWELIAAEVVMVTAAASLSPSLADVAITAWQMLSKSRRSAEESVTAMMQYAKAYSISPVPEIKGKKPDRAHLIALATNLPPMFRAKTKLTGK